MDDAQDGIAVRDGVHDHPDRDEVIDLVEGLLLQDHLPVNGIEVLAAAVDIVMDMLLVQALGKLGDDQANAFLPLLALHADEMDDAVVAFGIDILEGQVLQLLLEGIDTEAVRQGRIDIQRFPGDGNAAVLRLEAEGPHIVQTVGQFDQNDPDIPGHGEDHLPEGFRLGFLPVGEIQLVQLGDAVHEIGDLLAELRADRIQGDALAILDGIVQEARGDRRGIDHEIGEDGGDEPGMAEIRLTGLAELAGVGFVREFPGLLHEKIAVAGVVLLDPVQHLVQGHCLIGCESHG